MADAARAKVIVLPLANNTPTGGAELADRVHKALQTSLAAAGASVMSMRATSPAVRRAVDIEKTLEPGDLDITPPVNRAQAERIGRALGADMVLWGAVEEYAYTERAKQVTIGLSISKLDLRTNQLNVIAVSGKSAAKVGFEGGEGPLMTEAIDAAVNQVAAQVLGVAVVPGAKAPAAPAPAVAKKRDKTAQTIGLLLAVAAVAALASRGGGGAAAPLPGLVTNAVATPTSSTVVLSWEPAAGVTTVTSFNIYRAELGQPGKGTRMTRVARAAHSRVRLTRQASGYSLLANVGRADRTYVDTSALSGTLYAYKISAVVGSAESAQVDFYNFYELQRGAVGVIEVGPDWPTAPAMPTVSSFLNTAQVQWTKNPEPFINSYNIYRSTSAGGPFEVTAATFLGSVGADENTFEDPGVGLVAGNTYYYAIGAVTDATGPNGRIGAVRQMVFTPGKPAPPSDLRAEPRISAVALFWTPSADHSVTGYRIFRSGQALTPDIDGRTTDTFVDSGLSPDQTYTYQIASLAGSGASAIESDRVPVPALSVKPSSAPSSLVLSPPHPSVVANGSSTVDIFAFTMDKDGRPVQGVKVVFFITSSANGRLVVHPDYPSPQLTEVIEPDLRLGVTTNANGKAGARFQAGSTPGTVTVNTAAPGVDPISGAPITLEAFVDVALTQQAVAGITLAAESTTVPGDGFSTTTLTATVVDQGGIGVPHKTVVFVSQAPTIGIFNPSDAGQPDRVTVVTDADGKAEARLMSAASGSFGSCTVTATAPDAPAGTPPAQVIIHFVAAPRVTVAVNPSVLPAAGLGSTALITATAKFATGEPVADGTVIRFAFDPNKDTMSTTGARIADGRERALTQGGLAYSTLISATDLTNGDSDTIVAWIDSNDNGTWDSTAESLGSTVVTYTAPPASVTLTADPLTIPADARSVSKIVADVRTNIPNPSGGGNMPVADGTLVQFTTSSGTFVDSATSTTSGRTVGGLVTVYLKSATTAGTADVTGTAALISGSVQVAFSQPVSTEVSVRANPATLQANGTATSQITAHVKDATTGEPKSGVTVTFATDIGTLSSLTGTTNASGDASVTFTAGTRSGTATIVAKSGGAIGFVTLTLTSGLAQNVSLTILSPNGPMPATNGQTSPSGASPTASVIARVTDKFGNPVVDGTPVLFHTDIGQVDGSALTTNGVAKATLVTGNFEDATNKATYRPGWASITAYADNPAGPATAGPLRQVFCGDMDAYNWDGSANDSDLYTGYGADWRTGTIGSSTLSQPHVTPKAGDTIWGYLILADRNNNPLPAGVPVHWEFWLGGTMIQAVDDATSLAKSWSGTETCVSEASVAPGKFPDMVTVERMTIYATSPTIISDYLTISARQLVGAAGPAGTITLLSPIGNSFQLARNPDGPFTIQATLTDSFGNPVQDGNPVYFGIDNPKNVSETTVTFNPNPAFTASGMATTGVTIGLLDETIGGNFTLLAGSPQGPVTADATGTLSISVTQPPLPVRQLLVDYTEVQLAATYTLPAGLHLLPADRAAFSVANVGQASATVTITNDPDQTAPLGYITFRPHSTTPPTAQGDKVLTRILNVGEKLEVDLIVDTNGMLTNQNYTSTIRLTSPDGQIVYAPAESPQTTLVVVQ
jgi:hypothetical protein